MAKHRSNVFAVVRNCYAPDSGPSHVIGVYLTVERAEEIAGRYTQEMLEKGMSNLFGFGVQATTYYDE